MKGMGYRVKEPGWGSSHTPHAEFLHLKRTSAISIGVVMVWMCLAGGYILARAGEVFGWIAIIFGLMLLALPFTAVFRRYWNTDVSARPVPAMILVANAVLVVLYGGFAWAYLQDPFLTYNDANTMAAVVFGASAVISLLALAANIVALLMDRRSR